MLTSDMLWAWCHPHTVCSVKIGACTPHSWACLLATCLTVLDVSNTCPMNEAFHLTVLIMTVTMLSSSKSLICTPVLQSKTVTSTVTVTTDTFMPTYPWGYFWSGMETWHVWMTCRNLVVLLWSRALAPATNHWWSLVVSKQVLTPVDYWGTMVESHLVQVRWLPEAGGFEVSRKIISTLIGVDQC